MNDAYKIKHHETIDLMVTILPSQQKVNLKRTLNIHIIEKIRGLQMLVNWMKCFRFTRPTHSPTVSLSLSHTHTPFYFFIDSLTHIFDMFNTIIDWVLSLIHIKNVFSSLDKAKGFMETRLFKWYCYWSQVVQISIL